VQGRLGGEYLQRSLDLRSWEAGQNTIREWESGSDKPLVTIADAAEKFLRDAAARHTAYGTLKNLRLVVDSFKAFATQKGVSSIQAVSVDLVREFRESWTYAPFTAQKKLERLRSFFAFCMDSEWIERNPAKSVKLSVTQSAPTIPFTDEEVRKIFAACELVPDNWGRMGTPEQKRVAARVRAFVLALRYAGLRIGDAVQLSKEKVEGGRIFLRTEKTGTPVWVPVPGDPLQEAAGYSPKSCGFGRLGTLRSGSVEKWMSRRCSRESTARLKGQGSSRTQFP
jgi:integrase